MSVAPGSVTRFVGDYVGRARRRARDLVSSMGLELLGLASMAIIVPLTLRLLGPEEYGEYVILYLVYGLLSLLVSAGLSGALVQLLLQLEFDVTSTTRLVRRQLVLVWAPCSVVGVAIAVAIVGTDLLMAAVLVIIVDLLITGLANLNVARIFAMTGVAEAARIRMVNPVVRTVAVLLLSLTGTLTVLSLVATNVLSAGTMLVVSGILVRRSRNNHQTSERRCDARTVLRYSTYYSTSMMTNAAQDEGEKFVLAANRPVAEVGQYAAAYRLVSAALIPLGAVTAVASRSFLLRDDSVGGQRSRAARLSVAVGVYGVLVAIAILLGQNLVGWVAGPEFDEAATIAAWLCLFPLLHGLADIPPLGLIGLGRNRARVWMGVATSIIAIAAYLLLVPSLGWRGAVLGTYISELGCIIIGWSLLIRSQRRADTEKGPQQAFAGAHLQL